MLHHFRSINGHHLSSHFEDIETVSLPMKTADLKSISPRNRTEPPLFIAIEAKLNQFLFGMIPFENRGESLLHQHTKMAKRTANANEEKATAGNIS